MFLVREFWVQATDLLTKGRQSQQISERSRGPTLGLPTLVRVKHSVIITVPHASFALSKNFNGHPT